MWERGFEKGQGAEDEFGREAEGGGSAAVVHACEEGG